VTESQPARTNRDGHPCPPWCVTDHDEQLIPGHFSTAHGAAGEFIGPASARAILHPAAGDAAEVQVCTSGIDGGSLFLEPVKAGYLARMVEDLASATPETHRELAAAIRQAAADITGAEAQR
jgi:hypothetical protein